MVYLIIYYSIVSWIDVKNSFFYVLVNYKLNDTNFHQFSDITWLLEIT